MSLQATLVSSFNRVRPGYLLRELVAIREALIGSQALIALIADGAPPESLINAIAENSRPARFNIRAHQDVIVVLNDLACQLAMGDACLRLKQELPAAPPARGDVLAAMRHSASCKPDYKRLHEYVERELEEEANSLVMRLGRDQRGALVWKKC